MNGTVGPSVQKVKAVNSHVVITCPIMQRSFVAATFVVLDFIKDYYDIVEEKADNFSRERELFFVAAF